MTGLVLPALQVVVEEWSGEAGLVAGDEERGADSVSAAAADGGGLEARDEHRVEVDFGSGGASHKGD